MRENGAFLDGEFIISKVCYDQCLRYLHYVSRSTVSLHCYECDPCLLTAIIVVLLCALDMLEIFNSHTTILASR